MKDLLWRPLVRGGRESEWALSIIWPCEFQEFWLNVIPTQCDKVLEDSKTSICPRQFGVDVVNFTVSSQTFSDSVTENKIANGLHNVTTSARDCPAILARGRVTTIIGRPINPTCIEVVVDTIGIDSRTATEWTCLPPGASATSGRGAPLQSYYHSIQEHWWLILTRSNKSATSDATSRATGTAT